MKQQDVIAYWANRWRSLAAWRGQVAMKITVKTRKTRRRVGSAWSHEGRAIVYVTNDLGHDLATVLHELAHLAAPNSEHHGEHWRTLFVAAAVEVFGGSIDDYEIDDINFTELDRQIEEAARDWLKRTGQAAVLHAIGVTS